MSSSAVKLAANAANAQNSTGPRTPEGKAASSQNATKSGLFSTRDFIRPGEESVYAELTDTVRRELAPVGNLECTLADEIRRATWRLRRCGETEADMVETCVAAANGTALVGNDAPIPDPLQIEATAKLQFAVNRARAQCHRLIYRCTAELRKLQTERNFRLATGEPGLNTPYLGLTDVSAVSKNLREPMAAKQRREEYAAMFGSDPMESGAKQTQHPGRNSRCACGSGLKYKRCCALIDKKAAA